MVNPNDPVEPDAHAVNASLLSSAKCPPFNTKYPSLWFHQIEAQFEVARLPKTRESEKQKFYYLVANLPSDQLVHVIDLLNNPPDIDPYMKLKEALLQRVSLSDKAKIKSLLSSKTLGDRKPSLFLRELQTETAGLTIDDGILKEVFLNALPATVQRVLAIVSKDATLETIASHADEVMDIPSIGSDLVNATMEVAAATPTAQSENAVLVEKINILTERLDRMEMRDRSRERGRSPYRNRNRSSSTDRSLCYYHNKFGEKAWKCRSPCRMSGNGNVSK